MRLFFTAAYPTDITLAVLFVILTCKCVSTALAFYQPGEKVGRVHHRIAAL